MRSRELSRSHYWRLAPLVLAVACGAVSFFVPARIGNWLVVIGIAVVVAVFGPAFRRNGGGRFFAGRR